MSKGKIKGKISRFQKGQSGNPAGRPIGAFSPLRKQLVELRKLAANDISDMYNNLKEAAIKNREPWAYQIYFKELVSIPKEWLSEINTDNLHKVIKDTKDIDHCISGLIQEIVSADNLSTQEAIDLLKVLNSIKNNEIITEQITMVQETREELSKKIDLIQRLIDVKQES